MQRIICILFLVISTTLSAQSEAYKTSLETFKKHYNDGNAQSIFDMMNTSMQQQISLEIVERIVSTFSSQLGILNGFEFQREEGPTEVHTAKFEKGDQNMTISLDNAGKISGLLFTPTEVPEAIPKFERNTTSLILPFKGEWFTVWGGDTKAQNYHVIDRGQRRAFDFLVLGKNRKTYERSGTRNEDYFAFGKPLYAVCDAEVVQVIDGVEDNKPGDMNPKQMTGNSVVLKTANNEYIFYAHFENSTIKVKEGDFVKQGQYLGNCGNSGNSTEPHLHLHIQDGPDLYADVGVKCYFDQVMVGDELRTDYSPVRLDKISRPEE